MEMIDILSKLRQIQENNPNAEVGDAIKSVAAANGEVNQVAAVDESMTRQHFQYVADILTQDYYNTMSTTLSDMTQNANIYPQYEAIRIEITRAFEGLRQCVYQYATLLDTQAKYAIDESILNDMEKLKIYLEGKRGMSIFPDCDVTVGYATLKPIYAMYVELFGFPEGCVFEVDKLAIAQSYL